MKVFTTIKEIRLHLASCKGDSPGPGFVPTMGALHEGHLSLVKKAVQENALAGLSIFVNPIQFNNPSDLDNYPRTLESDLRILNPVLRENDFVFAPSVREMYPEPVTREYQFGNLGKVMEGRFRPGHFNGVAIVVNRLFRIVEPARAYFGEKDFQQLAIIRRLVEIENMAAEIVPCPIIREPDGLAMSSRNVRMKAEHRKAAPAIYRSLYEASQTVPELTILRLKEQIQSRIDSTGLLVTEYVEFADETTLLPVTAWSDASAIRCFVAVQAGDVRLIDNMPVQGKSR
ncbi:MAG: pantoate--beta-alanine ligase [Bacteroidota bacterium]